MARIKTSVASHRRKKRVLKKAKGQVLDRSKRYRQAKRSLNKGMAYAYRDRKVKKREYRKLWIARLNAACRELGLSYSRFIKGLTVAGISINRKMLSELAIREPAAFKKIVETAQSAVQSKA